MSTELARALRTAGLRWKPTDGDRFCIESGAFDGEVFTISEMTVEVHDYPAGRILGFNGTTEWALDSVDLSNTLWLPREDQLRRLLRGGFGALRRIAAAGAEARPDGPAAPERYAVDAVVLGRQRSFTADTAADAYAEALLALVQASFTSSTDLSAAL